MGGRSGDGRRRLGDAGRILVALLSVLVLTAVAYGWAAFSQLSAALTTSDVLAAGSAPADGPRRTLTALLVGLDSRTDAQGNPLPAELLDRMHAGPADGQLNTDTIVLLRIPADPAEQVVAVSFPRDSYVQLADGFGTHKINSAYGRAATDAERTLAAQGLTGAALQRGAQEAGRRELVATVAALTGITIDHYAEINLAGFVELTDAIGGVPVCLNAAVDDREFSGALLPAGPQTVRGTDALAFVRQRHGLPDGDLDRITRQQAYLAGLAHTVLRTGTLTDPATVRRLLDVAARYLVVDRSWNLDQLVGQVSRLSGGDVVFHTIPTLRSDLRTPEDGVAVQVDTHAVRSFVREALLGEAPTTSAAPSARLLSAPTTDPFTTTTGPATTTTDPGQATTSPPPPTATTTVTATATTTATATATATPSTDTPARPPITGGSVPCVN